VISEMKPTDLAGDAITVRAMRTDDVAHVADVHLVAFPRFFLTFLGRRFLRLFYSEAVELREIALVAEARDGICGFVMGSARPGGFFKALLRRRAVAFAVAAAPAIMRQPSSAVRLVRALLKPKDAVKPSGVATLMSLAVDPRRQSVGAGRTLVNAFLHEARRRGSTTVDLTTDKIGNDRVNRFYESLGFRVVREVVTPEHRVMNEYEIDLSGK
jgi:ribosomal protein S18 acetylase RimI-like enzyme